MGFSFGQRGNSVDQARGSHSRPVTDREAAIEAQPDTRVTLETSDFDTVVQFVVQYVAERLSETVPLEVAS